MLHLFLFCFAPCDFSINLFPKIIRAIIPARLSKQETSALYQLTVWERHGTQAHNHLQKPNNSDQHDPGYGDA